jgi:PAS domain S-box-containing protein
MDHTSRSTPVDPGRSVDPVDSLGAHEPVASASPQELRSLLAAIVDSSDDAVISKNLDGLVTSWNQGATRIYGYTAGEMIGRSISLLVPEGLKDEIPTLLARLRRGERVDHFETVRRAKDGRLLDISLTVSPIRDEGGRITGASAVGRDVTAAKDAEAALGKELRNHQRLQQISSRLIPADDVRALYGELIEAAIDISEADRGTMQIFDRDAGELVLLESKAMPAEIGDAYARVRRDNRTSCGRALDLGERVMVDYAADGSVAGSEDAEAHMEVGIRAAQSTPLVARSGRMVGMLSTHWDRAYRPSSRQAYFLDVLARQAADLIERAEAESQLRESARRERERADDLAVLMDLVPAVVFLAHDPTGKRITGSRRAHDLLRVPLEGNLSRSADEPERPMHFRVFQDGVEVPPEDLPVQRAARGEPMHEQELEVRFEDGTVSYLFGNAVPVHDEGGGVRGAIAAMIDITDRKRAEQALREADRRKDEFLATLAHELRSPLAAIRTAVKVLDTSKGEPARVGEMAGIVERQSWHLVRLIDDLMDVSRISLGKVKLERERVDLVGIVEEVVSDSGAVCREKGLGLGVSFPEDPVPVHADPVRMAQVMNNLVSNACKFTPSGGDIRVSVEDDGAEAVVRVADTGIGMSRGQLTRVFELFVQGDAPPGQGRGGLGIGLSLSRSIVELHGGRIEARSEGPGKGSEFVVRLSRLASPSPGSAAGAEAVPRALSGSGRRVLLAEDHADSLHVVSLMLRLKGHEVETAADGIEALGRVRELRPEVVLLDIGMPGLDGYEVARRIRREPWGADVLLVAMTGWGEAKDKRRARDAGFDAHLTKPVDFDALQAILQGGA